MNNPSIDSATVPPEEIPAQETCAERVVHPDRVAAAERAMPDARTFDALAEFFAVLSNQTRLRIVHALSIQELCVCDLAALLDMSDSAVSHQLRHLRALRLVRPRRQGKLVYYNLDDRHVQQLVAVTLEHLNE